DLRFGLEIVELTDWAADTEFQVFKGTVAGGGKVRAVNVTGGAEKFSRKQLDELAEYVKQFKAKGRAWGRLEAAKLRSATEKSLPPGSQQPLRELLAAKPGDLLLFVADTEDTVAQSLGALRGELARRLGLIDPARKDFKFAWVVDFPSFI